MVVPVPLTTPVGSSATLSSPTLGHPGVGEGALWVESPGRPSPRSKQGGVGVGLRQPCLAPHRQLFPEWGF